MGSSVNYRAVRKLACAVASLGPGLGWLVPWPGDLVCSLPYMGHHCFLLLFMLPREGCFQSVGPKEACHMLRDRSSLDQLYS